MVWAAGDENSYQFIIQYIAHIFQHPAEKNPIVLQFYGNQGDGKSIISQTILGALLKRYHGVTNDIEEYLGRFNWRLCNKLLIVLDEIAYAQGWKWSNRLKAKFANERQKAEKKYMDAVDLMDYSRHILESNHKQSVKVEVGDRRYAVFEVSSCKNGDMAHFNRLRAISKDENALTHLFNFFQHIPITINFNDRSQIPQTEYR